LGGKFHLKLNIGRETDSEVKYREGKMKRTLKRELNKGLKLLKRKRSKRKDKGFVGIINNELSLVVLPAGRRLGGVQQEIFEGLFVVYLF